MWYFAWILGLPLAVMFAVMNAIWLENKADEARWREQNR
jgi:cyd operon protein YbgT